jgi:hypothetical protein
MIKPMKTSLQVKFPTSHSRPPLAGEVLLQEYLRLLFVLARYVSALSMHCLFRSELPYESVSKQHEIAAVQPTAIEQTAGLQSDTAV